MNALQQLEYLGNRFHGADLSFRRKGTDWPAPWRARLHATKNERSDYRIQSFGNTAEEAIARLVASVESVETTTPNAALTGSDASAACGRSG